MLSSFALFYLSVFSVTFNPSVLPLADSLDQSHFLRRQLSKNIGITSISAFDQGGTEGQSDISIDVSRGQCNEEENEPFFPTLLKVSIRNSANTTVNLRRYRIRVRKAGQSGLVFRSRGMAFSGVVNIAPGETEEALAFLATTNTAGDGKVFVGSTTALVGDGTYHITVIARGRTALGEKSRARARVSLSFAELNRCS